MIHLEMGLGFITRITKWYQIHAFGTILVEVAIYHYMSLVKGKKLTVPTAIYLHYVSPLKGPCDTDTYVLG